MDFFFESFAYVSKALKEQILITEHDSQVAGHFGQDNTMELIRRNFWWPSMKGRIVEYVQPCLQYQQDKARRYKKYGLLSPLGLPHAPWQSISMYFITGLPLSKERPPSEGSIPSGAVQVGYDEIWVIVDRFTKLAHFVPLAVGAKTAADLATVFAIELWRLHGLPQDIVLDRGSRFTSATR